jgi:hypothetical protein
VERFPRKPEAVRNIEDGCQVSRHQEPYISACSFGHAGKLMKGAAECAFSPGGKFGKKLTNNFIILCELPLGTAFNPVTQS